MRASLDAAAILEPDPEVTLPPPPVRPASEVILASINSSYASTI